MPSKNNYGQQQYYIYFYFILTLPKMWKNRHDVMGISFTLWSDDLLLLCDIFFIEVTLIWSKKKIRTMQFWDLSGLQRHLVHETIMHIIQMPATPAPFNSPACTFLGKFKTISLGDRSSFIHWAMSWWDMSAWYVIECMIPNSLLKYVF